MVCQHLMKLRLPASWYGTFAVKSYQVCAWHIKISNHWMIFTNCYSNHSKLLSKHPTSTSFYKEIWLAVVTLLCHAFFTCSEYVDGKFIIPCVLETVKLFQTNELKTSLLICDGCPVNLTTIKTTHAYSDTYSVLSDGTRDQHEIKFWMICTTCRVHMGKFHLVLYIILLRFC